MKNFNLTTSFLLPSQGAKTIRPVNQERVNEMLADFDLDWSVKKEPLFLGDNIKTDYFGVVRQDTREVFQTCTKQYKPFQNELLMELALTVADAANTEISDCKTVNNGGMVYITIEGRKFELNGQKVGDVINEQIIISNSHNGTSALRMSFGHLVLSCTNGMTRFDKKGSVSIRHTDSMERKVKHAIKSMPNLLGESERMIESYHLLEGKQIGTPHIKKALEIITGINPDMPVEKMSTRALNILKDANSSFVSEMSYKGQTAWGLLNGVTHYTTQLADKSDSKLASKMFGNMARREMSAWDYLMNI